MTTSFHFSYDSKIFELVGERVAVSDTLETWRVSSRGDVNRFITLTNNRPELHARQQYKAFYKWTVVEGDYTYRRVVDLIKSQLEYYIRGLWKPAKKGRVKSTADDSLQRKLF